MSYNIFGRIVENSQLFIPRFIFLICMWYYRVITRKKMVLAIHNLSCYHVSMLTKLKKQRAIKTAAVHDKDTGSSEVQIALLTKKIEALASHLKKNAKDKHSRRGLLSMVADRQTHMKYLASKDTKRYNAVVKKLELKKA